MYEFYCDYLNFIYVYLLFNISIYIYYIYISLNSWLNLKISQEEHNNIIYILV